MFFIVWGFRGVTRTIGTGRFYCPTCGVDRDYKHQKVTKWFTLFWIPLFPVGKPLGEQVQCTHCRTKFKMSVLDTPTSEALTEQVRNATRIVVASLVKAGDVGDPAVRAAAIGAVRHTGLAEYDEVTLMSDVAQVDGSHLAAHVGALAAGLNDHGREVFVARAASVVPPGTLNDVQIAIMQAVGASLGLSAAHLAGILGIAAPSPVVGLPAFDPTGGLLAVTGAVVAPEASPVVEAAAVAPAAAPPQPPAAWYPDPSGSGRRRWWDGQAWTEHLEG